MSIPQSEYKNQKCACFVEIERLESENARLKGELKNCEKFATDYEEQVTRLKSELENVHRACDAIEKERTDYLHDCDPWKNIADQLAGVLKRSHPYCRDDQHTSLLAQMRQGLTEEGMVELSKFLQNRQSVDQFVVANPYLQGKPEKIMNEQSKSNLPEWVIRIREHYFLKECDGDCGRPEKLIEALSIAIEALEAIRCIQSDGSNGIEACQGEAEEAMQRIAKLGESK